MYAAGEINGDGNGPRSGRGVNPDSPNTIDESVLNPSWPVITDLEPEELADVEVALEPIVRSWLQRLGAGVVDSATSLVNRLWRPTEDIEVILNNPPREFALSMRIAGISSDVTFNLNRIAFPLVTGNKPLAKLFSPTNCTEL